MSHEPRLAGKTILITAAAQGIGRASALACAKEGAHVIATDINFSLLEELPKLSKHIQIEHLDVCDAQAIKSLASRTPALDVLFNCAGMVHHGSVLECDDDAWALSFNVNVTSMHRMIRAFLPGMLERAKTTLSKHIQIEHLDVCDAQAIKSLASRTPALDVLFNCAGMVHHGSVLECDDDAWALSFNVNVTSMHRMIRAFLPGMLERAKTTRSASIINTASIASSIKGLPNRYAYGASKAAVVGLTKALAADFVGQGLRCNALCPGTVDTPSLRGRIAAAPDPVAAEKNFIARQPIGRLATVDDITPMVVFLASDESRYITGQNLSVDGGISI